MDGPADSARIYLLEETERHVVAGGPAVIGPDGSRQEIPYAVYRAVEHVVEAMRAGTAVKVSPLRTELPIDEAADAIAMGRDDLRRYVADGAVPFRTTEYVDWVRLADVLEFDRKRRDDRRAGVRAMLADDPWGGTEGEATQP